MLINNKIISFITYDNSGTPLTETFIYFSEKQNETDYNKQLDLLHNKLEGVQLNIDKIENRITIDFLTKAPKEIVERTFNKLHQLESEEKFLWNKLNNIRSEVQMLLKIKENKNDNRGKYN